MSLNITAAYLEARLATTVLHFSKTVTTANVNLSGPGGGSGDGFPLPFDGRITNLVLHDGTATQWGLGSVAISAGDRVQLAAAYNTGTYTVTLNINGSATPLQITGVQPNTTLYAALSYQLQED